ncbi:hypothetical protein [Halomonas sp. C22]|uniref:hypothetical protein n=1 Tax=Halomonas sp. C22 TaxID=2580567 RepID=UPI0016430EFD|nr:hypothetical protein [Halomonas sp. C22]
MSFEQAVVQLEQTNAALQEEVVRFRDAAMGLNAIYPTITEGRQAVSDGKYFSVPGNGAYMRLYRRQGSSAELIAEFPDRAQVQSLVDTLGGRGVVGGSGDLMAQGYQGLGSSDAISVPTLKANFTSGFNRISGSTEDAPPGIASNFWGLGLLGSSFQGRQHSLINFFQGNSQPPDVWFGARSGDPTANWSYARAYHNRNILGTVSQVDGVPTGAIIERGGNANGEYVKFADGTLFMWLTVQASMPLTGIGSEFSAEVNYPVRILSNATTRLIPIVNSAASAWSVPAERWKFDIGARTNTADYGNVQGRRREAGVAVTGEFLVFVSARWA